MSQEKNLDYEEVIRALEQGKVIHGVFESAQILQMDVDNVMACILNEQKNCDLSVKIQHTLIEAYCWENEIRVIKVGPEGKLSEVLANLQSLCPNPPEDYSCSIVMYPSTVVGTDILTEKDEWSKTGMLQHG